MLPRRAQDERRGTGGMKDAGNMASVQVRKGDGRKGERQEDENKSRWEAGKRRQESKIYGYYELQFSYNYTGGSGENTGETRARESRGGEVGRGVQQPPEEAWKVRELACAGIRRRH